MKEIRKLGINNKTDFVIAKDIIKQFAQSRKVSNTMIAYKLYRADLINYARFLEFKISFRADWLKYKAKQRLKARETEGGTSYYVTKKHRVGNCLIKLVSRMMYGGAITTTKAGKVLGVKPQNVPRVLENSTPFIARNMV